MSNFLDDLFASGVPSVSYVWTGADMDPSSGDPIARYASGTLVYTPPRTIRIGRFVTHLPPNYADTQVTSWRGEGVGSAPSSWTVVEWVNELTIFPSGSSYTVTYSDKRHTVSSFSFVPTIQTGQGFPGFPGAKTGILTGPIWLGVDVIVISLAWGD